MTEGSILRHLIMFAFPLLLGNLFQQFYNMVDTWVVGNFVSNEAFSAVGTVAPIINMLIGFFTGLATGAGAVISQYYGAKMEDKVRSAVHTSILMTVILGVLFTGLGIGLTPALLSIMGAEEEVLAEQKTYLIIYFAGILGLMIYNMGSGILRAVGDSRRPFLFLVVSALMNVVLDLVFVLVFDMGVAGVAYATIISQAISAILTVITLFRSREWVRLSFRYMKFDFGIFKTIFRFGFPAAFQMALVSFSNVFVQSYINYFGTDCMSGWTAYQKIESFPVLPIQSISLAATTFVAQNLGAGKDDRAKQGIRVSILLSMACTVVMIAPLMVFAPTFVGFFNSKPEVIADGALMIRWIFPFLIPRCATLVIAGVLRGSGKSRIPMIAMIFSFVVFRQIYLFVMANYVANEMVPIFLGYPLGWAVCAVIMVVYYWKVGVTGSTVFKVEP